METAKEFLSKKSLKGSNDSFTDAQIEEFLTEFAKGHCEEQAKAITEEARILTTRDKYRNIIKAEISIISIFNAYPIDKIK
jgi:hypothetical protein